MCSLRRVPCWFPVHRAIVGSVSGQRAAIMSVDAARLSSRRLQGVVRGIGGAGCLAAAPRRLLSGRRREIPFWRRPVFSRPRKAGALGRPAPSEGRYFCLRNAGIFVFGTPVFSPSERRYSHLRKDGERHRGGEGARANRRHFVQESFEGDASRMNRTEPVTFLEREPVLTPSRRRRADW